MILLTPIKIKKDVSQTSKILKELMVLFGSGWKEMSQTGIKIISRERLKYRIVQKAKMRPRIFFNRFMVQRKGWSGNLGAGFFGGIWILRIQVLMIWFVVWLSWRRLEVLVEQIVMGFRTVCVRKIMIGKSCGSARELATRLKKKSWRERTW